MSDYAAMGLSQSVWDTRRPHQPDAKERKLIANRIHSANAYERRKALRVNKNNHFPTTQADDDKQQMLRGYSPFGKTL